MQKLIIDIDSENVNYVELLDDDGTAQQDLLDCNGSGSQDENVAYITEQYDVEFHIVAKNKAGDYENRIATHGEITKCAKAIYFESDTDFRDIDNATQYLVWEAAHRLEDQLNPED